MTILIPVELTPLSQPGSQLQIPSFLLFYQYPSHLQIVPSLLQDVPSLLQVVPSLLQILPPFLQVSLLLRLRVVPFLRLQEASFVLLHLTPFGLIRVALFLSLRVDPSCLYNYLHLSSYNPMGTVSPPERLDCKCVKYFFKRKTNKKSQTQMFKVILIFLFSGMILDLW